MKKKILSLLVALFIHMQLTSAMAATITVNTTDDENNSDGDCSLREAIESSETDAAVDACTSGSGIDTVNLPAGTFTLTSGELVITHPLTLEGDSASTTVIIATASSRVINLTVATGGVFTFRNFTMRNGSISGANGGNMLFTDSSSSTLHLENLIVLNGVAAGSGASGGGVHVDGDTTTAVTIEDSVFEGNSSSVFGGALYILEADFVVSNSDFKNNSAQGGAAIAARDFASGRIENSLVSENTSFNEAAIFAYSSTYFNLEIVNSTISNNTAQNKTAIYVYEPISNGSELTIYNSTITENTATLNQVGGVSVGISGNFTVFNSIIAKNLDVDGVSPDCSEGGIGSVVSAYSLIGVSSTSCDFSSDVTTLYGDSATPLDPDLGVLADNGGLTQTHLPNATSLAINGGNPSGCEDNVGSLLTDQRGEVRPDIYGEACDIGAVEVVLSCGDARTDGVEACDDGNADETDACLSTCQAAACGDGFTQAGVEECDDGNLDNDDGCSSTCALEVCGDGILQTSEACDDGNLDDTDTCSTSCQNASCGDGFVQAGVDECDDGNLIDNDGCNSLCVLETCGDGIVQTSEVCDDGNIDDTDACPTSCQNASCGDGFVQTGVDECDDGNVTTGDGCDATCSTEPESDNETPGENPEEPSGEGETPNVDEALSFINPSVDFDNFPLDTSVALRAPDPRSNGTSAALTSPSICSCHWKLEGLNGNFFKSASVCDTNLQIAESGNGTLSVLVECPANIRETYSTQLVTEASTPALSGSSSGCSLKPGSETSPNQAYMLFTLLSFAALAGSAGSRIRARQLR